MTSWNLTIEGLTANDYTFKFVAYLVVVALVGGNNDRDHGNTGLQGQVEGALFERQQTTAVISGSFGEHPKTYLWHRKQTKTSKVRNNEQ